MMGFANNIANALITEDGELSVMPAIYDQDQEDPEEPEEEYEDLEERKQIKPRYPDIEVQLTGEDGNSFFIVGRVRMALRDNGVDSVAIRDFTEEATSGDYDHMLQTVMKWVKTH